MAQLGLVQDNLYAFYSLQREPLKNLKAKMKENANVGSTGNVLNTVQKKSNFRTKNKKMESVHKQMTCQV